jgi:DNA-binding IclR family transcriptional regulator
VSTTGTQAIDRAAELLGLVVRADQPPAFGDLVADTGLAKSTASRLLQALERHRLVQRGDSGTYAPGSLFALYATRHEPVDELIGFARPTMLALNEATRETVNLAVLRGNTVVQVAQIDSTYILSTRDWVDVDVPPHCSALGKVFYAAGLIPMPSEPFERRTDATITTRKALESELAKVRNTGYAVTLGELEVGLDGIAAPVTGSGDVIAAIGVSGPSGRINHRIPDLGTLLVTHAERLSCELSLPPRKEGAA